MEDWKQHAFKGPNDDIFDSFLAQSPPHTHAFSLRKARHTCRACDLMPRSRTTLPKRPKPCVSMRSHSARLEASGQLATMRARVACEKSYSSSALYTLCEVGTLSERKTRMSCDLKSL